MEINKPDAVVSDLDGSLLARDQSIGKRDRAAIRRMLELGVPVLPGTGRPPIRVRGLMEELGLTLALCSNGGCCCDFNRDELLFSRYIETDVARRLIHRLLDVGRLFVVHTPRRTYRSPGAEVLPHYDNRGWGEEPLYRLTRETPLEELEILKVLVVECDVAETMAELRREFSERELTFCASEESYMDCNPPGVSKGEGLRRLADQMGWRMENIVALGDNFNDKTMLEAAGKSAAPAGGAAEICALAKYVTTPCGEDPLAAALEHFYPELMEGI